MMRKIFEILIKQLIEFFRIKHAAVFQLDPSEQSLKLIYCSGFREESIKSPIKLMAEEGIFKRLVDTQTPQIVNDIFETEENLSYLVEKEGLNSMIAVPIFAEERLWGILTAFSHGKSRFSEEDGKIISLFGGQTGQLLTLLIQHLQENLDESLVQVLGSIELFNFKYENKKTIPTSEILKAHQRLKNRIRSYVAGLEQTSLESRIVETEAKEEQTKLPPKDELNIEEVITIQGEKNQSPKTRRVLVIDDQPIVTDLLVTVLERMNCQTVVASCGKDGVDIFRKDEFDLVITDLGMPDVSGWEVSKAVKRKSPHVPVVVITGWGVSPDPEKMKDSKVDLLLNKPFQIDQLEKIIQDLLEK